jgi:hypothetical protein
MTTKNTQLALVPTQRSSVPRKKLLILPQFQLVLIGVNIATVLVTSLVIWVNTRNTLAHLKPAAGLSGHEVEYYNRYLQYQTQSFESALLISLLVGLAVSAVLTLVLSHRLSGPLVRMRGFFSSIRAGGPVGQLKFREGDYMRDLPPIINGAIERIRGSSTAANPAEKDRVA